MRLRTLVYLTSCALICGLALCLLHQARGVVTAGAPALGDPIANLTGRENQMFDQGDIVYTKTWDPRQGLGPVYTQDNCTNCHASPIAGGGGGSLQNVDTVFATVDSSGQFDPMDGTDPTGSANEGGVLLQPLSIQSFVPHCTYPGEVIPTSSTFPVAATLFENRLAPPNFGMGLIDSIPASAIESVAASQQTDKPMGVAGVVNNVNDEYNTPSVGKFGFKAQYATLTQFIGTAMTQEVGITVPFYNSQGQLVSVEQQSNGAAFPHCILQGDTTEPNDSTGASLIAIFHYLLYLAPNQAATCTSKACLDGQAQFSAVGCNICHLTPSQGYTTGTRIQVPENYNSKSACEGNADCFSSKALSSQPVPLYSDLLLHNMGVGTGSNHLGDGFCSPQPVLAGDCPFGQANGTQFRTTPLWGLSLRKLYLHDGRTTDLTTAIEDHAFSSDSEAAQVVAAFNALTPQEQSDLITFLNTL